MGHPFLCGILLAALNRTVCSPQPTPQLTTSAAAATSRTEPACSTRPLRPRTACQSRRPAKPSVFPPIKTHFLQITLPETRQAVIRLTTARSAFADQRNIMCAPAGCRLMEWPKNAPDTASVPGSTHPPRRKRKHPSVDANRDLAFLLPGEIPVSPRHEEPQSEKDEWAEFDVKYGVSFPQRR